MNRIHPVRSATPLDLREAGSASEVKKFWTPDAFVWFGAELNKKKGQNPMYISYSKKGFFRISIKAAEAAGISRGDCVKVGLNKTYLAITKDEKGIHTRKGKESKTATAIVFSAAKIMENLKESGWPENARLTCEYDEKSKMLIAKNTANVEKSRGGKNEV